jgi:hypothetical protein
VKVRAPLSATTTTGIAMFCLGQTGDDDHHAHDPEQQCEELNRSCGKIKSR